MVSMEDSQRWVARLMENDLQKFYHIVKMERLHAEKSNFLRKKRKVAVSERLKYEWHRKHNIQQKYFVSLTF